MAEKFYPLEKKETKRGKIRKGRKERSTKGYERKVKKGKERLVRYKVK